MSQPHSKIANTIRDTDNIFWTEADVIDGSGMNMYVSAQDLALWGYLHLKEGKWGRNRLFLEKSFKWQHPFRLPTRDFLFIRIDFYGL
jgi:hypothetical protein